MKSNAQPSPEYKKFDSAMRRAFQMSKTELQRRLDAAKLARADKPKRGPKPKTTASDHAASDRG